jgi:hypothetical protein
LKGYFEQFEYLDNECTRGGGIIRETFTYLYGPLILVEEDGGYEVVESFGKTITTVMTSRSY